MHITAISDLPTFCLYVTLIGWILPANRLATFGCKVESQFLISMIGIAD